MEINKTGGTNSQSSEGDLTQLQKTAILWTVIAFILAIVITVYNNDPAVISAGFFKKAFAIIVGTALGVAGAMIGDVIRRYAQPSFFLTGGGVWAILKIKVFWAIGPQTIGVLLGAVNYGTAHFLALRREHHVQSIELDERFWGWCQSAPKPQSSG